MIWTSGLILTLLRCWLLILNRLCCGNIYDTDLGMVLEVYRDDIHLQADDRIPRIDHYAISLSFLILGERGQKFPCSSLTTLSILDLSILQTHFHNLFNDDQIGETGGSSSYYLFIEWSL